MERASAFRTGLLAALACCWQPGAAAQPIPVRHVEGTVHGFLSLRAQDGRVVAVGDLAQVARGSTVTAHLVFHFRDGSVDDDTTVFSERGSFRLITDHHIQQGPTFPQPMDLLIDVPHGRVTSRSRGKDGKDEVTTDQMALPPDLANGLVSIVAKNLPPQTPEVKVHLLVATPKPRLVTLAISPQGEQEFTLDGSPRKAVHFEIQIQLGAVTGVVATLIGKHLPDIQLWILGGDAPTFLREQGPLFQDGPIWTMELASPDWPTAPPSAGN
ncbi:MAG: hypothetical protein ABSG84_18290 [Acidobacteriaceae bacterium]|jgi:hypothetical protein